MQHRSANGRRSLQDATAATYQGSTRLSEQGRESYRGRGPQQRCPRRQERPHDHLDSAEVDVQKCTRLKPCHRCTRRCRRRLPVAVELVLHTSSPPPSVPVWITSLGCGSRCGVLAVRSASEAGDSDRASPPGSAADYDLRASKFATGVSKAARIRLAASFQVNSQSSRWPVVGTMF